MKRTCQATADFEDGGGEPRARECGQFTEARKGKETDSLLEPAKNERSPTDTLIFFR